MEFTKEKLEKVAENARLLLTEEELEKYTKEVNRMVQYVKKIMEIRCMMCCGMMKQKLGNYGIKH